jgi:hypothetical protein
MAVDWSIFWNNIFPGLILIISSSIGAYIVVHRYQRKKHEKEIRDDLIQQEHELLNKYWKWIRFISKFLIIKPIIEDEIEKEMKESDKAFDRMKEIAKGIVEHNPKLKETQKTEEEEELEKAVLEIKQIAEKDRERLLELRGAIEERQNRIESFTTITDELTIGANLLLKRLINQLGLNKEQLDFFATFNSEMRELETKVLEKTVNISSFFVKVENLILKA